MKQAIWSVLALRDLEEAASYHREIDADYSDRLLTTALATGHWLATHPSAGSITAAAGVRKWRVAKTPYLILYRPATDALTILRVIHAARDWKRFL